MPVVINASISIPDAEMRFLAVRSTGPGGQNVNKVNSRVILKFDLIHSSALNSYQKRRVAVAFRRGLRLAPSGSHRPGRRLPDRRPARVHAEDGSERPAPARGIAALLWADRGG